MWMNVAESGREIKISNLEIIRERKKTRCLKKGDNRAGHPKFGLSKWVHEHSMTHFFSREGQEMLCNARN